jgi:hypothetical protein
MKRFSDTARVDEDWYCQLPLEMRAAFELLWAKADAAGVWAVNHRLAEFHIGKKVNWSDFLNRCGGRIIQMDEGRYLMRDLIRVNYGKLSRDCRPHTHVFSALEKHGIDLETVTGSKVSDTYPVGISKDKEQDKDQYKEEDQDKREGMQGEGKKSEPSDEEAVLVFCAEQGIPADDGRAVWAKWQGNGFTNNRSKMKDWKATIRSWNLAGYLPSQKNGSRRASPSTPDENQQPF